VGNLVNPSYLPPFTTVSTVTATRALNTAYTNSTGMTMHVAVTVLCHIASGGVGNESAYVQNYVSGTTRGYSGLLNILIPNEQILEGLFMLSFPVPNGSSYRVDSTVVGAGCSVTLYTWTESS
jgi:hypothetical protein